MGVQDEILAILEELGGEVVDPKGRASRKIFDRVASTGIYSTVGAALRQLEEQGLIVRDMPTLKSTTRIALNREGTRPGMQSMEVVLERFSRSMADQLSDTVHALIETHVAYSLEQAGSTQAEVDLLKEQLALKGVEIRDLKRQLREESATPARLRAQVDQLRSELEEECEARRIAEHNAQVWKNNALRKPADHLDPEERRALDRLMRELPRG